ncbi:unnamed protein product [Cyclocybe aegerita]|uniref:Uncharacterized protein n=1 Tax=Cyclocybe aegerita TaxID=1973307 RepID=A0A8S0VVW6_CYCAE|nr:unnamed protein product [Cyclocybe aegerita]
MQDSRHIDLLPCWHVSKIYDTKDRPSTRYIFNKFQKYKHSKAISTRTPPTLLVFILPSTTDPAAPDVAPKAVTCPAPPWSTAKPPVVAVDTTEIIVVMSGPPTCVCSAVPETEALEDVSVAVTLADELLDVVSEGNVRMLSDDDDDDTGGGASVVELHAGKPGTVTVAIWVNEHWELYPGWRRHEESSGRSFELDLGWRVRYSPSATFARSNAAPGDAATKQLTQACSGSSIFFVHRQARVSHIFKLMGFSRPVRSGFMKVGVPGLLARTSGRCSRTTARHLEVRTRQDCRRGASLCRPSRLQPRTARLIR